jgi:hypothetical protein
LKKTGAAYGWGWKNHGQVGNHLNFEQGVPLGIPSEKMFLSIVTAPGSLFSAGMK